MWYHFELVYGCICMYILDTFINYLCSHYVSCSCNCCL